MALAKIRLHRYNTQMSLKLYLCAIVTALAVMQKSFGIENFDDLFVGEPAGIEKNLRELLSETLEHRSIYLQILSQIALAEAMQKKFEEAHATLDHAESLLTHEDHLARARILLERGRVFHQVGDIESARPFFEQSYEICHQYHLDFHTCNAAHMVALVAKHPEEKIQWNELAISLAERSHNPKANAWLGPLYNNLGAAYLEAKQYEKALNTFLKYRGFFSKQPDQEINLFHARMADWRIASCLRYLGRADEALAILLDLQRQYEAETLTLPAAFLRTARGYVYAELAAIYAEKGYQDLSKDEWVQKLESEKLKKLQELY